MLLDRRFRLLPSVLRSLAVLLLILPCFQQAVRSASPYQTADELRPRGLSFEQRVAAQKAIEEVFWRHRIWPEANPGPKPPLEEVLPDSMIRERVLDTLKKSAALEKLYGRPLTGAQLRSEVERMARNSRQPEVLRELFASLHDDPLLIAECLARPALAERLIRSWYAFDERRHGILRAEARRALSRNPEAAGHPLDGPEYQEITWRSRAEWVDSEEPASSGKEILLPAEEYQALIRTTRQEMGLDPGKPGQADPSALASLARGRFGPLQENEDSFYAKTILAQSADSMRVGILSWKKTPFETWWNAERSSFDGTFPLPEDQYERVLAPDSAPCTDNSWTPMAYGPEARTLHAAVWTGSEMLVWGGKDLYGVNLITGSRYNPATDSWSPMSQLNVPSTRSEFSAVWTGTVMIIYGGIFNQTTLGTGSRYNPTTDSWSAVTAFGARRNHTAIWTGFEMIIWGGSSGGTSTFNTGGRYNPSSDTWVLTSTGFGVPPPRRFHSAVWTGSEMIIWGGQDNFPMSSNTFERDSGGRYSPGSDTWSVVTLGANSPSARYGHVALWTGSQMIIHGGLAQAGDPVSGARYNPDSGTWSPLNTPSYAVSRHAAVWTGSKMISWGGYTASGPTNQGFLYDPASDTYVTTNLTGAPGARQQHTAIWTGSEMIVWGGSDAAALDSGGRYDPSSDSWVPTGRVPSPKPRSFHSAIWTGAEMIVWGGGATGINIDTGGRYVPATDSWTETNSAPGLVPEGRTFHSTVWTGTDMIVWGGMNSAGTRINSGGRYNPASDAWLPTGTGANLPAVRAQHTAIWTGTEMIVWGGSGSANPLNSGGRYNPASDTWIPTGAGSNLPSARSSHIGLWTGDRMFIWGGSGSGGPQSTGGLYDPAADSWAAVSTAGAPPTTAGPAVWTGAEAIVWGSSGLPGNLGGRYNPVSNSWTPTSTGANVPAGRSSHLAVWANGEMIIWGGSITGGTYTNTGGRYDPASDSWMPTGTGANVPTPRATSAAVWTGSEMLVWGGFGPSNVGTGARYCRQCATYLHHRDRDQDLFGDPLQTQTTCNSIPLPGFVAASGDCLDTNAAVYPGAPQICDGLNDDCLDPSWPTVPASEANGDGDAFRICQGDCDDGHATVYPAAPQICDGLNNDCLDASWPTVPASEADADGDGSFVCTPDCSDGNAQVWAPPSEVSGLLVLDGSPTPISWTSQSGSAGPETAYDFVGGTLTNPVGSGSLAAAACLQPSGPNSFSDTRTPGAGSAYWYLARAHNSCGTGTYGAGRDAVIPPCP